MSQWNNSYNYNNQYQGANTWNGDVNGQYANHSYYPNSSNQYVSFNEFVSQIQGNNVAQNTANYNNVQYQNYPASQQYNYQDPPSSSQNAQVESYNYGTSSTSVNNEQTYQAQTQYKPPLPEPSNYTADMVKKSNLTATATEFVPKNKNTAKPKEQDTQAEPPAYKNGRDSKNIHSSSSDKNWRERRQPQTQDSGNRYNNRQNDSSRGESSTNYKNYDSSSYNRENNSKNRNRDYNNRKNGSRNEEGTHSESSNNYGNYSRQNESSSHNERNRRYDKQYNRNDDQSGYHEYSNSGNEANSRRYDNDRGPSRSKTKNKDIDRTFYNSSINKSSQDVRGGRGEGSRKNWSGRVRGGDRPTVEDEQYASNYLQYRDEKEKLNRAESAPSPRRNKSNQSGDQKGDKELTQRERLSEQLDKGTLECLVCCERVKQIDMVWSCANCYHVLHLKCIKKWAVSSVVEGKWRCPACQNTSSEIPSEYRCMCGSVRAPEYHRGDVGAHTCGDSCRRQRPCGHPCPLLCHPGPCPPCQTVLHKPCGCGAEMRRVVCSDKTGQICGRICDKELSCTAHRCNKECHEGPCDDCEHTVTQICYCMEQKPRTVPCTRDSSSCASYCCGGACLRVLACGAHSCARDCHPPPCEECELLPENLTTCPCGKTKLDPSSRKTCSDPIPLCGNICAKPLQCGPAGDKHFCKMSCHEGDCPACDEKTLLQCRCGHSSREVPCADLPDMLNNVFCQRKCNKKLSCDRHRCRSVCCALTVHRCGAVCGRSLPCQLHRCQDLCHTGHCAPCPNISFSELTCACGAEVLYPPIRCGTKPPRCSAPCRRARACGHPPHHACHAGDCPPCVVLTTKSCHGRHEERKTIPCSQEEFSCGLPCGKPLPCGKHTCIKTCHKGPCDTAKCVQPCQELRARCGHPCAAACHPRGERCPSAAPCRRPVRATCPCGRRHADRSCADNARDLARIMSALAATKMQEEGSVDLSESQRPAAMLKTLECDDECRVEARTRQLALALQIRNPDVSAKLAPRYSDHVRTTALKEPAFAQQVHDQLSELVQRAKKSKQKTRSHSFPSMNWQKRQFIHELCEHFGCESVAYDAEPNRNVVATADKEKSWLPAMSVMEVLSREAGKRRVPGPILRAPPAPPAQGANKSSGGWATLTSTNAWAARSQAKSAPAATASATTSATATVTATTSATTPAEKIDYFDNPPDN